MNTEDSTLEADRADALNRVDLVRLFERWLEATLADEEPPKGIDAELLGALTADAEPPDQRQAHADSYALWSAVTALTQEVKLQGRAFKELHGALGTEAQRAAEERRALNREREREIQRDADRRCRREIVTALIELRDSLGRGLESVRAVECTAGRHPRENWLLRIFTRSDRTRTAETLSTLTKGYALGLGRLEQILEDFQVHEIFCEGQRFDARRMNAIDREPSRDAPEGTVLEVYRKGYEWNGEVFRAAHVKVACAPHREATTIHDAVVEIEDGKHYE